MSRPDFDLKSTTSWLQAKIQHPGTEPPNNGDSQGAIRDIVESSDKFSAEERLAIYQRAYYYRLVECLRSQFPVLLHFLEDELFTHFAMDYLAVFPSKSYSLHELGAPFADHLAATRPDKDLPPEERESWPDFIIELAQLERAFYEVYDGPGAEQAALLQLESFLKLNDQEDLILKPVPCLRLLAFRYPVIHYFREVRAQREALLPDPQPTYLIVTRRDYIVRTHHITPLQYDLLQGLVAGQTVGEAIRSSQVHGSIKLNWFKQWVDQGLFLEP